VSNPVHALPVAEIRRREDARPLNDDALAELADSIRDLGLINPITVRQIAGEGYEVIAGNHRLAAVDLNGEPEILCVIVDDDDLTAELRMIDENLMRAELSTAERAKALGRRKAIYEALHPQTRHGANASDAAAVRWQDASRQVGDTHKDDRFTANTASVTGRSERTVQRDVERGERIAPEALDVVAGTHRDTGRYLDELKTVPREEQVEKAKRDVSAPRPTRTSPPSMRAPNPLYAPTGPAEASSLKMRTEQRFGFLDYVGALEELGKYEAKDVLAMCPRDRRAELSTHVSHLIDVFGDIMDSTT